MLNNNQNLKLFGIYSITFVTDYGKLIYIGSTSRSFQERFQKHTRQLAIHTHHNSRLQRCWDKYKDTVEFNIIESCDCPEGLLAREQFYMDMEEGDNLLNLGPALPNPMAGMHQTDSAKLKLSLFNLGKKHTPEAIEKMRLSKLGKRGHKNSPETRLKISLANTGRKHTLESKEKISRAHKGKIASLETREKLRLANLGKKHSEESKAKMSKTRIGNQYHKGIPLTEETKRKLSISHKKYFARKKAELEYVGD
jgi:hypothetical protein